MKDGFYRADYMGPVGQGTATFAIKGQDIIGTDVGGGQYMGRCQLNPATNRYDLELKFLVSAGMTLVTDGVTRSQSEVIPVNVSATEADLGRPITVHVMGVPIRVMLSYLGAELSAA